MFEHTEEEHLKELVSDYELKVSAGELGFLESDTFLDIIFFYEKYFKFEKALNAVEQALEQHRYCAALYIRKAQILLDLSQFDPAHEALDQAALYEPASTDVILTRAEIYNLSKNPEAAHAQIALARTHISPQEPEYMDVLLLESAIWETQELCQAAYKNLYRILQSDIEHELAGIRLRLILDSLSVEEMRQNLPELQTLVDENPYSAWAWDMLGVAFGRLEQVEEALEAFDYARVINETFAFGYYDAVDLLIEHSRFTEALDMLKVCLEQFGEDAETLCRMGECYQELNEYLPALEHFHRALNLDNLQGQVYEYLGDLNMDMEQADIALGYYELASKQNPRRPDFMLGQAQAHAALCNKKQAHEFFKKAVALASVSAEEDAADFWFAYLDFLIAESLYPTALALVITAYEYGLDKVVLDYAKAAILLVSGESEAGFLALQHALQQAPEQHPLLFEFAPDLHQETAIWDCIERLKTEL